MNPDILASQKHQEMLAAFWPRKVSRYVTAALVKTPITPNQTTVLWGAISVANCWLVYLALAGHYAIIPLIPIVYQVAFVLDCVDGEIARYKNMVNPIGGKLLDGICHRATEFSLLATFAIAAYAVDSSLWAIIVGLFLLLGDAMYVFVYERRLTALRVQAGLKGQMRRTAAGVYQRGMRWRELTRRQQRETITGLVHHKSVYAVIALSYLPPSVFITGLAALAAYKHVKWVRLVQQTLVTVANLAPASSDTPEMTAERAAPPAAGART
jgi:phosphatidylglycerophosphate synthase